MLSVAAGQSSRAQEDRIKDLQVQMSQSQAKIKSESLIELIAGFMMSLWSTDFFDGP